MNQSNVGAWLTRVRSVITSYVFLLFFGALLLFSIWGIVVAINSHDRELSVREIERSNDQLTRSFEEHVRSSLFQVDTKVQLVKSEYERAGITPAVATVFEAMQQHPLLLQGLILDSRGEVVFSAQSLVQEGVNFSDRSYFQYHQNRGENSLHISEPLVGRNTGKMSIYLSRRLSDASGNFAGVIVVAVNPEYFVQFYRSMELEDGRLVRIVGTDGVVRASWNQRMDELGHNVRNGFLFRELSRKTVGRYQSPGVFYGVDRFFSYRLMSDYPLVVQVGFETDLALVDHENRKVLHLSIAGLINAIVLLFGYFAIRREQKRQKAELDLKKSDQLNRTILETTQDGVAMVDLQGRLFAVNQAYCQMTGYSRQELVVMQINQVDADEDPTETRARIARIVQSGSERFEVRQKRKDGTVFDAEVTATYVSGEFPRLVCFCRDISEKKQAFAELQQAKQKSEEHEARYKALHDASFGGIVIHDQGVILDANQGLTKMTGYLLPELIGMDGLQLIAPDSREWVQSRIVSNYEKPYAAMGLRKNGEVYPLRIDGRAIPYMGKMVRATEFRDITEQREVELRFLAAHERLKTVLDSMDALVYIADMKTHELLFINSYGIRIWGEASIGKFCYSVLQGLERPCPFCTNDKLVNADGTASGIYQWEFQNKTNSRWYDISDQAIQWLDGRLVRMEIAKDIGGADKILDSK